MYSLTGKAAIISDLHLGSVTCLHHQIRHFLETVHAGEYSLLVIAGDLLESTTMRLSDRDWKVLSKLRRMTNDMDVVWMGGNHDAYHREVLGKLLGMHLYDEIKIVTKAGEILVIHGHQFDSAITKHPHITAAACWVYLLLQRFDRRHRIAQWMKRTAKKFSACATRVKAGALKYTEAPQVICGHSHAPETDGRYINSGSWVDLRGNYVEIGEDGVAILKTWEPKLESQSPQGSDGGALLD